ncbi:MAG: hypothetical protein RBT65_13985 [Methanolobus sp.]|nr:hypothetical protein [Methanolobus sp.]
MKTKMRFGIGALLMAMLLVSMAFVPAVSAQAEQGAVNELKMVDGGEITPLSAVGTAGETLCDGLLAALWSLDQFIDDSRIGQAQDKLDAAAEAFRNNNITNGMDYLSEAISIIWDILNYWGSQIASCLYNKLVDLLNAAQDFINQYS